MIGLVPVVEALAVAAVVGEAVAGSDPQGWEDILRRDIAPVASAYVLILTLFAWYRRTRRRPRLPDRPPRSSVATPGGTARSPGLGALIRYLAATVLGGYAVFLAIVVAFYFVLGGESESFIDQALGEGSILAFLMAFPALLLLGWAEMRRPERAGPRAGSADRRT